MKSTDEILASIRKLIERGYQEPAEMAGTMAELDTVLWYLHWLYADIVGGHDDFGSAWTDAFSKFPGEYAAFRTTLEKFDSCDSVQDFQVCINKWKQIDQTLAFWPPC